MPSDQSLKIVEQLEAIYQQSVSRLRAALTLYIRTGERPDPAARENGAFAYPEIMLRYDGLRDPGPLGRSFGRLQAAGDYAIAVTQPELFAPYLAQQIDLLLDDYGVKVEATVSRTEIPYSYVLDASDDLDLAGAASGEFARIFPSTELSQIGDATVWVCLGLWAWSIQGLLSRGFYARGEAWVPSIIGSVVTVLATPLFFVLSNTYGVIGLAAASSIAISLNVFALAVLLRRRAGAHAVGQAFLGTLVRMGGATAASCLLVSQGSATVALDAPALVRGAVWGGAAVVLSALFGLVLGVEELKTLSASLSRRLKRRR